jgi:GNAT superfamily N-acetyltransferase
VGCALRRAYRGHCVGSLETRWIIRVGRLLLEKIESFASACGYKRLFLSTTTFLGRAIRLYESFGFQRLNDEPHDLFGTPLFTMEKVLGMASLTEEYQQGAAR